MVQGRIVTPGEWMNTLSATLAADATCIDNTRAMYRESKAAALHIGVNLPTVSRSRLKKEKRGDDITEEYIESFHMVMYANVMSKAASAILERYSKLL